MPKEKGTNPPPVSTQELHPARAVFRTAVALAIGAIPVGSLMIKELGLDSVPFFATMLGVGAGITRVMATPAAILFIDRWFPWLNPTPQSKPDTPPEITP